ncbi:hypothetical protein OROHE_003822 [Orobanche hederae]
MTVAKHSETSSSCQPLLSEPHIPTPQPNSHPRQYVIFLPPYPPPGRQRLLGKTCMGCIFCFPTSLLFHVAAAFLLWPSDPDLSIVRLRLDCLHLHTRPKISLDVIMDLNVRVFNKDFYSMNYDSLLVAIGYRGEALGNLTSDGGFCCLRTWRMVQLGLIRRRRLLASSGSSSSTCI